MLDNQTAWEQLCEFAETTRHEFDLPGMAIGVSVGDEVMARGFGVTNIDHPLEVTENTYFQIGSITKTYTGTVIMKLVDEGKIDLSAPVRTYLPDFQVADKQASAEVTVYNLLTHTCGWVGDLFTDTGAGDDALVGYVEKMAELEQMSPVGRIFSYNNAAFTVLGRIIEVVTEQPYEQVVKTMLLKPLGLANTSLEPNVVMTHRFAVGHIGGNVARPWPIPRCAYPAGGIACDVHDLLAFGRFHMGDGTTPNSDRILNADTIENMRSPAVTVYGNSSWGLSWAISDHHAHRRIYHSGGTLGQVATLVLVPEKQLIFAFLSNADVGGALMPKLVDKMAELFLDETKPDENSGIVEVAPAAYVGTYYRPMNDLIISDTEGQLTVQMVQRPNMFTPEAPPPSPQFKIEMRTADQFQIVEGPMEEAKGEFIYADDGTIGWLRMFGRVHKRA